CCQISPCSTCTSHPTRSLRSIVRGTTELLSLTTAPRRSMTSFTGMPTGTTRHSSAVYLFTLDYIKKDQCFVGHWNRTEIRKCKS
ncbi:hypothetical protein V5799_004914, partial [Amblyomma americanum]